MKNSASFRGFSAYRLWSQLPRLEISYLPDVVMFGAAIALFYGVLVVGRDWFSPFTPEVEISRSLLALPAYAGYSLLRITIAYVLSLMFALAYGSLARRAAVDPRAQFFASRDAGYGRTVPYSPTRRGDGRHPFNLHRASVEHGLQLLRFAQKHSQRDARGGKDLRL